MAKLFALISLYALLGETAALAGTCHIQSTNPPGQWKFFRVHDAKTGEVVRAQAINGGDSKELTSKHDQVKVEFKLPGDIQYRGAFVAPCKDGNTIRG